MSKELAQKKPTILDIYASKMNLGSQTLMTTLKNTIMKPQGQNAKEATESEVCAFLLVAHKYDLNPFTKEIYAFPDKKGGIVPVVGIDGFITLANRHPQNNGSKMVFADEMVTMPGAKPCPAWCEVHIYRKDMDNPIIVTEYLDEVYRPQMGNFAGPWQTHTKRMLRHKALIQAYRVAFGLTGIYDEDEASRIIEVESISSSSGNGKPEIAMPAEKDVLREQTSANEEPTAWEIEDALKNGKK